MVTMQSEVNTTITNIFQCLIYVEAILSFIFVMTFYMLEFSGANQHFGVDTLDHQNQHFERYILKEIHAFLEINNLAVNYSEE